jgi:hypothetical protein
MSVNQMVYKIRTYKSLSESLSVAQSVRSRRKYAVLARGICDIPEMGLVSSVSLGGRVGLD